ncbi:MAG TPA: hypothetical protein VH142_04125 [Polyangiaceae bacterium]|nr:hypothetical protein [Polyangiaceae bacterium]
MTDYGRWSELSDREELGESLTAEELSFLAIQSERLPAARAETRLLAALAALPALADSDDALDERTAFLADRAVATVLAAPRSSSVIRRFAPYTGAALALAAGFALWVGTRAASPLATGAASGGVLEVATGQVEANGVSVVRGAALALGSEVAVTSGVACIALEPTIHACLPAGARLRIISLGVPGRRVELLAGHVDVALFPLPAGQRFSVVANGTWSTAFGTAFTVALSPDGSVQTVVHEGKVRVGAEEGGSLVMVHQVGVDRAGDVTVTPLVDHAPTETSDWKELGVVAGRPIEGAMPVTASAPEASAPAADSEAVAPLADPASSPAPAAKPAHHAAVAEAAEPTTAVADAPSAAALLARARQSLREQRWADAASAYSDLVSSFPASAEAHTVLVPLAGLEIDRLGQPSRGLALLDQYLSSDGPLDVEARLAKIRAYRSLGDTVHEHATIDEFLTAHPTSLEAASLRARLATLNQGQ